MQFNSLAYVFGFLPLTVALWATLRRTSCGNLIVACLSVYFYASSRAWYVLPLFTTALLDYWVGQKVFDSNDQHYRKALLILSIVANLALLSVFKYTTWVTTSLAGLSPMFAAIVPVIVIALPPAISFYTFQSMSYTIDIYRNEFHPYRNVIDYISFVTFFPHLVAGPIMRARDLLPQLARHRPLTSTQNASLAIFMILFGLFQKSVLADNAGSIVESILRLTGSSGREPLAPGLGLIFAYAFAVQIYCDFAAYTTIARGSAKLLNVELMRNFLTPYFAMGPSEFWHRWHISLSTWLRDYLYIPIGGNRGSKLFVARNIMITMLLGGLWHGAGVLFIAWGAWHGLLLIIYRFVPIDRWLARLGRIGKVISAVVFFHLVCIGWIFFRAKPAQLKPIFDSILAIPDMARKLIESYQPYYPMVHSGQISWSALLASMANSLVSSNWNFFVYGWGVLLFAVPVFVTDLLGRRHNLEFIDLFPRMGVFAKAFVSLILLYGIIFFAQRQASEFIYFAF